MESAESYLFSEAPESQKTHSLWFWGSQVFDCECLDIWLFFWIILGHSCVPCLSQEYKCNLLSKPRCSFRRASSPPKERQLWSLRGQALTHLPWEQCPRGAHHCLGPSIMKIVTWAPHVATPNIWGASLPLSEKARFKLTSQNGGWCHCGPGQLTSNSLLLEITNMKPSLCDLRPNCESALNEYTSRRDDIKTEYRILQIEVVT